MNKLINRTIYLGYYFKKLDKVKFNKFMCYAAKATGRSRTLLWFDALQSVYVNNIGLMDYFYFRFFEKSKQERSSWAGTGYLYEYQLSMNPKGEREVLENKIKFLNHFKSLNNREFADISQLKADRSLVNKLLSGDAGKLVIKGSHGQVGAEVEVINCEDYDSASLLEYMTAHKFDMAEEYVVQHLDLMALSPTGLNTLRVFTQLYNGKVEFLGARQRISVNSPVDNLAAGNIAAPVDMETGLINGPGVYSDITKKDEPIHPITKQPIEGFQIPFWKETLDMLTRAALMVPENRSIGWDVAITENGPELIEGNHNWCKLLWQLPVKQGLKHMLKKYE